MRLCLNTNGADSDKRSLHLNSFPIDSYSSVDEIQIAVNADKEIFL